MLKDENKNPFDALDSFNVLKITPSAFTGAANARGDKDGTQAAFPLFGVVTTTLVGAGTLEVGVASNTASLIAQVADATILAENEIWNDATPTETEVGVGLLSNITGPHIVVNGVDIIETCAGTDITAGNIYYICLWRPLSEDGNVVPA